MLQKLGWSLIINGIWYNSTMFQRVWEKVQAGIHAIHWRQWQLNTCKLDNTGSLLGTYASQPQKKECANHAIKCYRSALERLVEEKPKYKGKGKFTTAMRKKLTTAARCAIKVRSGENDTKHAVKFLRQDLRNGPLHCFGVHTNCSTDYCKVINSTLILTPLQPTMTIHVP